MRQTHVAGHKAFVDYSGKKVPITDPLTGEVRMAEIFVGVLGASNLRARARTIESHEKTRGGAEYATIGSGNLGDTSAADSTLLG